MPEDDEVLTLSHATERDVDLLLVEEIACGDPFLGIASDTLNPVGQTGSGAIWRWSHAG